MKETIDVIIPLYNTEKYIIHAIDSVMNQTYKPNQIIVVDDGSTDNSKQVVQDYIHKTGTNRIKLISKENGKLSSARNAGIEASKANYIAFLDADDAWVNTKLEKQIKVFHDSKESKLGLVYTGYDLIDSDNNIIQDANLNRTAPSLKGEVFEKLLSANLISGSGSGVLIKSECFNECGQFDLKLSACEDWDMWLRIAEKYTFDFTPEILVLIRKHNSNMQANQFHMFSNIVFFINKWALKLPEDKIPNEWLIWIINYSIDRLPKNDYAKFLIKNINKKSSEKLFKKTKGFIKLYLLLVLVSRIIKSTIGMIKNIIKNLRNIILVLFT